MKALASLHICTGSPETRHSNEISCAGSTGNLCIVYVNTVVSLHQQPRHICSTIRALQKCAKQCSQCVVIKFLNKTNDIVSTKIYDKSDNFDFEIVNFHKMVMFLALHPMESISLNSFVLQVYLAM